MGFVTLYMEYEIMVNVWQMQKKVNHDSDTGGLSYQDWSLQCQFWERVSGSLGRQLVQLTVYQICP